MPRRFPHLRGDSRLYPFAARTALRRRQKHRAWALRLCGAAVLCLAAGLILRDTVFRGGQPDAPAPLPSTAPAVTVAPGTAHVSVQPLAATRDALAETQQADTQAHTTPESAARPPAARTAEVLPRYRSLYEKNPDLIGWLRIDGTGIDLPVVQTPGDNEYYLRRGFDRFYAVGGTLFLDEIGELPLLLQAKLLRALQQGEVQRVGSDTPIIVDVRVIAATNRNLREEVSEGRFREDLYYRLNVIGVEVPSLRERREDIPVLATAFLERFALANRKEIKGFTPQAMDALLKYSWPGNVRELENAVERAAILCLGEYISERELPMAVSSAPKNNDAPTLAELQGAAGEEPISMTLDEMERAAILRTLQDTGDNKSEAARRLGITRATLHNKLRRYDME